MTAKFDIYQDVTDRIVAALEAGTAPWLRPWTGGKATGDFAEPYNAFSGRAYSGINWLILGCQPYPSKGWLTYKQAGELGGNVRKGERGTPIVFWSFLRDKDDPKKIIPFARGYTVFNTEQCEGLSGKVKAPAPAVPGDTSITALAARVGATVRHGGNRAFYAPTPDHIVVPSVDAFQSPEAYDATLAHELVHWTGHKSRCDRQFGRRFGDDAYAFEELVAEIGSAFVCAHQGVALEGLQHAAYVSNWLSVLRKDKRAIFTAASAAKKAAEFLTGTAAEAEEEVKQAA
jgi:antirestriction protein ArdC